MKKIILITLAMILIAALLFWALNRTGIRLDKPESVCYDTVGERFLISNLGNGSIIAMDSTGVLSEYMPRAFKSPKGIFLHDGKLYVTEPTQIQVVDVANASIIDSYPIEGAIGLNDIALTEQGLLYVTDTLGDCVYVYDPATKTQEKIISPLLDKPNGIVYDRPRWQMFVVNNSTHSPILSIDVRSKETSIFMDTIYSQLDGIAIDDLGRIYFSSWAESMIIEIPQEQNRFITKLKDYEGAADLYYHLPGNELIVPMLKQNRIERISLD
ncbi:MAG: SMP-30/gluconolactonase/LRE family protein [Candidatus Cloacimonetes bacterium]|nr:SMP-30/gluconolactonase/LRE family protein [Candidatus Cloacimonadota bacterium]MCB5286220.1 SMP-30/gluconolactonase/LRE family protein [Candidatus Cloacimonadota bacterium]MCK9183903.1 SMP-30/gluconolactonase/LRE family protein [Candidatus Cloacimonadota bacterium]MCK9584669.1 SMP-30/gluconolactonase/LRE family protein [Candidatus Cloacimonadota bacterium]MDY0228542.1 SMP-30/gluconolactonase/LRE family protein [Candidatus Cloacimonadaceae bacterium]